MTGCKWLCKILMKNNWKNWSGSGQWSEVKSWIYIISASSLKAYTYLLTCDKMVWRWLVYLLMELGQVVLFSKEWDQTKEMSEKHPFKASLYPSMNITAPKRIAKAEQRMLGIRLMTPIWYLLVEAMWLSVSIQLRENIPTQQGPAVLGKTSIGHGCHVGILRTIEN